MPEKFFQRPLVRRFVDLVSYPLTWTGASLLKYFRKQDGDQMPLTKKMLVRKGIYPVSDRYDDPLFQSGQLKRSLQDQRPLPGINWNAEEQLSLLGRFHFNQELTELDFNYNNGIFESGDAEYLYNMIRFFKPARIIEAGGGYSSLIARLAIQNNKVEDPAYDCRHVCIDPHPSEVLIATGVELIKDKVESLPTSFFQQLSDNDILFIDTSHMIRPQGDVLYVFLELLPQLAQGVWVHIHDIFTPRDYPESWVIEKNRFWNEQYLLEAFLSGNQEFRITGALNYLNHNFNDQLIAKCPVLAVQPGREPGSFWFRKY
jgi:hypothetical protein